MSTVVNLMAADGSVGSITIANPVINTPQPALSIANFSDLSSLFAKHTQLRPVVSTPPELQSVATPHGQGFQFVCSDSADVASWDSTCKAVLARRDGISALDVDYVWEFYVLIPTQVIQQTWHTGLLWEFHTQPPSNASGCSITLDTVSKPGHTQWRWLRYGAGGYAINYGPDVVLDAWHHIRIEINFSVANGHVRYFLDGVQTMSFAGSTSPAGEQPPFLQFGWYSSNSTAGAGTSAVTNTCTIAGITRS